MKTASPRDLIVKTLKRLAHSRALREVWNDWLEAMALAFANMPGNSVAPLQDEQWTARENRYLELVKCYKPEEWRELAGLLGVLTELLEQLEEGGPDARRTNAWRGGGDPLGELFMSLEFGNADAGQFFTPWDLTMLKAQLTLGNVADLAQRLGFVTVEDPAVGSGTTLLAVAAHARTQGVNPQTQMRFHGRDISLSAVHIAYVNCAIRGLPAVIEHGDTLRMEIWSRWETPAYIMGLWRYRRQHEPDEVDVDTAAVLAWLGREPDIDVPLPLLLALVHLHPSLAPVDLEPALARLRARAADVTEPPEEFVSALHIQA